MAEKIRLQLSPFGLSNSRFYHILYQGREVGRIDVGQALPERELGQRVGERVYIKVFLDVAIPTPARVSVLVFDRC